MGPKGSSTTDTWGDFAGAFDEAQINITKRARIGYLWPLLELFEDRNSRHAKVISGWLHPVMKRALEEKKRVNATGDGKTIVGDKTFLQHLADSTENPSIIRDQLLNMLLAARDTTACVLTFVTYFMAMHPEIATQMRAEVLGHCRSHSIPTFDQIYQLKYIRAVLDETLPPFPPVQCPRVSFHALSPPLFRPHLSLFRLARSVELLASIFAEKCYRDFFASVDSKE